jgi:hypothetical protein
VRRRRDEQPAPSPRLPGAGTVEPVGSGPVGSEPAVHAEPPPPAPPTQHEPEPFDVVARFGTAAGALAFAGQAMQARELDSVPCYRSDADQSWLVEVRLTLNSVREMADLAAGRLYVKTPGGYVRDRGWGEEPGPGPLEELPAAVKVGLLELVRVAGLHPAQERPLREAYVLVPGYLVPGVLERGLELRLRVTYQQVRLEPLFDTGAQARVCYAVRLAAVPSRTELPAMLLAALRDDPFSLVCRSMEQALLIGYATASPLSDRALARLVAAAGDETWLLAGPPDGCARVSWIDEPLDAANFVRLAPAHALTDVDGSQPYAESADESWPPRPRPLTLVHATARTSVDAVLLDDADLDCLPLLLAGEPLADFAFLIRGASRHLLSAPGGLLAELAVGEPLTCVGPGGIYLPVGCRLDPPVGPRARAILFQPDESTAQVVLPDARLVYDLDAREPVWRLWAGPVPVMDPQLPSSARTGIEQVALEVGDRTQARVKDQPSLLSGFRRRTAPPPPDPSAWREEAFQAERQRNYATAAQLYARNSEPLRAARLWEREAEEEY